MNVRTTAYCVHERGGGGRRNAVGEYLSHRQVRSAASDWSRFVTGTTIHVDGGNLAAGGWGRSDEGGYTTAGEPVPNST